MNNKKPVINKATKQAPKKPQKVPVKQNGLVAVQHRNAYNRSADKKMAIVACISVAALLVQIFLAYLAFTAKNERVYIATDKNGSLIELVALGQPNQKNSVVAQWVQNAMVDTFSFDFINMRTRLNETTMEWFTKSGADSFIRELDSSGYMQVVENEKMIMNLTLEHTPILVREGNAPGTGIYTWTFQTDAIITFRTQTKQHTRKVRLTTTVERVSVLDSVEGLGVSNIVLTQRN